MAYMDHAVEIVRVISTVNLKLVDNCHFDDKEKIYKPLLTHEELNR